MNKVSVLLIALLLFDGHPIHHSRRDKYLRMFRLCAPHIIPDWDHRAEYFVNNFADGDVFLRMKEMYPQND